MYDCCIDLELTLLGDSTRIYISEGTTNYPLRLVMRLNRSIERNFSLTINTTMDTASKCSEGTVLWLIIITFLKLLRHELPI